MKNIFVLLAASAAEEEKRLGSKEPKDKVLTVK